MHPREAALLLLLCLLTATVRCTVKTCEQGQVWARGRELINAMKGQLVLVSFPNAADRATLQKLSSLAESHPSVRVIALLDPASCSVEEAAVMGRDWRWLVVDRDDLSSRQRLGLKQGEVALFDRCGRLSRTLSFSATEELNKAMRAALHHANCGWCQYGTESAGEGATKIDKKLDAFFQQAIVTQAPNTQRAYPHHHQQQYPQQQNQYQQQNQQQQQQQYYQQHQMQQQQHQQNHNQMPLQQGPSYQQHQRQHPQQQGSMQDSRQQQQHQAAYEQQLRQLQQRTQLQSSSSSPYHTNQQRQLGQSPGQITHSSIPQHEYAQRGMTVKTDSAPPGTPSSSSSDDYGDDYDEVVKGTAKTKEVDLRKPAFNEDAQWATASPFHQRRQHKDLFAMPPPTTYSYPSYESTAAMKSKPTIPSTTAEAKKAAAGFEDYSDYEDYGAMKTFNNNNNNDVKQEEVVEVARSTQARPRSVDHRAYDPDPSDEDEVPCKAITDDICYHQKKSGRKLSKCCKKGLYIADFCLPGKCSNTTVQACCMQKYLQAKYQCCENPDMEGTTATDAFSRCCHGHFVEEDDCCPPEAAGEYWQSVHDICLPNVQADLSTVKFEIRLSDGIRVLDLAEPDKWQHECRYGGKRAQYVYVP